jgi:hypothetical protein
MALEPFVGPWPLLQFCWPFFTVGRTPWTRDQHVASPLPTHRITHTQSHPCLWVGFEPTIPPFKRATTVHALDRATTAIGTQKNIYIYIHIIDVNSVLGLLHRVVVGDVTDVSDVHVASIFRVDVCRLMSLCIYGVQFREQLYPPYHSLFETVLHAQTLVIIKTSTLKTESTCASRTSSLTKQCNSPRSGLTSTINSSQKLKNKSQIYFSKWTSL